MRRESFSVAAPEGDEHDRPLTVMTFNIHHGEGIDGVLDLRRIADLITSQKADVVGLQEVDRHWSTRSDVVDQAGWLAVALGMDVAFGANRNEDPPAPSEPRRQYGTAILSSMPIQRWNNTPLPWSADDEPRGLLCALITVRGVPLRIYNTHLQPGAVEARQEQVRVIRAMIGPSDGPVILMGDLNATPDTPEIAALAGELVDVWDMVGNGDGHTRFGDRGPDRRIDYVMTSGDITVRSARVVPTTASDHLPVVAEILSPVTSRRGHRSQPRRTVSSSQPRTTGPGS